MKHFVLLALLVMALVSMPVIASQPTAQPGIPAVSIGAIPQVVKAAKEFNAIGFDLVTLSAYNTVESSVMRDVVVPLGIVSAVFSESPIYAESMLAGLMCGLNSEVKRVIASAAANYIHLPSVAITRAECA